MFGRKPEPKHLIVEVARADAAKPSQPEVRAHKFVLTDADGHTRAQMQCVKGGAVALTFHNDEGRMGMLLGLDPDQSPTLAFMKDGKAKANLELDSKTHQPSLTLHSEGKSKVEIGFDKTDNAAVRLHDDDGQLRMSISLSADGSAQIKLFDKRGYVVSQMPNQV